MAAAPDPQTMLNNLLARKQQITNYLSGLTEGSGAAGSLPDVAGPGVNVQHRDYLRSLREEVDWIDQQISRLSGPFEIPVQCTT